jgi:hypothetical protein
MSEKTNMKINLEQPKQQQYILPSRWREIHWKKSLPFLRNPRGYLIHRVRSAMTHLYDENPPWDTVAYWCGNIGRGEFVDEPPDGMLLCAVCERQAVAHGQPTAEELVGRHVCTGRLRAVRICCRNDENWKGGDALCQTVYQRALTNNEYNLAPGGMAG